MQGAPATTANVMTEAQDRINIVSTLEDVRGIVEPSKQQLLDTMSAVRTNEWGGLQLYKQYSQQTTDPDLKKQWQEFAEETQVHVNVADRVIMAMGGDPNHKSPVAKELEKGAKTMMQMDIQQGAEANLVRLGHLVQAEHICKLHWKGVNTLARHVKDTATAKLLWDASRIVERDEDEHLAWNELMFETWQEKVSTGK